MQNLDVRIVEKDFFGIYDSLPGDQIPKGYFYKVDNAFCSDNKISRCPGSTIINTSIAAKSFNGFTSFEKVSSSNKWLVVSIDGATNAQLYKSTGGAFTALGSANLTNSQQVWFETANDILYAFNGHEVVSWDGTTVTVNPASVPQGYFAKWFHNYLFVAGNPTYPNRVYWSNLGDPTTFSASNFIDVNPGDSDSIQGVASFPGQDEMLIFKRESIWSITGFSGATFSSTTVAAQNTNARILGYGSVSPFSIVSVGQDVYFFSQLGNSPVIRSLSKTINAVTIGGGIISDGIRGTMGAINKSKFNQIAGGFDGRYVYWAVPTGSSLTNNQIIALDTWEINKSKGIYPFTTMSQKTPSYFALSTIPGYPLIYFSDDNPTGLVYKFDTSLYSDAGASNTMDVQTRDYSSSLGSKTKWKYLYTTYDVGASANIAIGARLNRSVQFVTQANLSTVGSSPGLGSFILGTSRLGGQQTSTVRTTFQQLTGHYLGLDFQDTTTQNVVLHNWEVMGKSRRLRGS